jgi:ubiquinone/menaquinone biosynthesis C-methylase UbiE
MNIQADKKINYRNFGFIPGNSLLRNLYGKLLGNRNLLKRLQARDIITIMKITPNDTVLDFGCGSGYMTVEVAKKAKKAFGIDINPAITKIIVPPFLKDKLEYIATRGEQTPFEDNTFDIILASEIIATISNSNNFLIEMKRILKPGGRLIICNGVGLPSIKHAFEKKGKLFRWLQKKYASRMPKSYEEYSAILNKSFGNDRTTFYELKDIEELLEKHHFSKISVDYSPGNVAGLYFSWSQFFMYLRKGKTLTQNNFEFFIILLSFIRLFESKKYKGGVLYEARNNK